jgi:predicted RNA-binding protein
MCLSKVFVKDKADGSALVEEASKLVVHDGELEIHTLFGEKMVLKGYMVQEIDLMKNYIVLEERR